MLPYPGEEVLQLVHKQRADDERDPETEGIQDQQHRSFSDGALTAGEHQRGTEKCSDAGRPSHCEHCPEDHSLRKCHLRRIRFPGSAGKQVPFQDAKIVKPQKDHDSARQQIEHRLVTAQHRPDRGGKHSEQHEYGGKSQNESARVADRLRGRPFSASHEERNIYRDHGQQTGRKERDDPFQKHDKILHALPLLPLSFLYYTEINNFSILLS